MRPASLVLCVTLAATGARADVAASLACEQAAAQAELAHDLPQGLLAAIGRVESGRRDPASGELRPWPWTINANGQGAYLPDQDAAVATVGDLQNKGLRSIDVGCFQVNLFHHPNAFRTLADAFVPSVNADYAARFLHTLWERTGSWAEAVSDYHSSTPGLGQTYWGQVAANWHGGAPPALAPAPSGNFALAGVHVWVPTEPGSAPVAIRVAATAASYPAVSYLIHETERKN